MLVDVVVLRVRGVKLSRAEILDAIPVRGHLQLSSVRPGWFPGKKNAPLLAGLVLPGSTEWALPPLDEARIERIKGANLYIRGVEELCFSRNRIERFQQGWWCRLAFEPATG